MKFIDMCCEAPIYLRATENFSTFTLPFRDTMNKAGENKYFEQYIFFLNDYIILNFFRELFSIYSIVESADFWLLKTEYGELSVSFFCKAKNFLIFVKLPSQ